MHKSTRIIIPAMAVAILAGSALYGIKGVSAMGNGYGARGFSELSQKIAERFNLNKGDVEKVFSEERVNRQVEMKKKMEDRLNQSVKDGKLTEDQKTSLSAIINKHQADKESMANMTPAERQKKRAADQAEIQKWASDNGINLSDLKIFGLGRMGGGRGNCLNNQ